MLFFIPESPRWLIEKKREDEAKRVMDKVKYFLYATSAFSSSIKIPPPGEQGTWSELFSKRLRLPADHRHFARSVATSGPASTRSSTSEPRFSKASVKHGMSMPACSSEIVINGSCVFFTLIAIASVDKWGRRPLMLIGTAGMGASPIAMGVMGQTMHDPAAASDWMLAFMILYIGCFGLSVDCVVWVILLKSSPPPCAAQA